LEEEREREGRQREEDVRCCRDGGEKGLERERERERKRERERE